MPSLQRVFIEFDFVVQLRHKLDKIVYHNTLVKRINVLWLALGCNIPLKGDISSRPEIIPFAKRLQLFFKFFIHGLFPLPLGFFHFLFVHNLVVTKFLFHDLVPISYIYLVLGQHILVRAFSSVLETFSDFPSLAYNLMRIFDVLHRILPFLPHFSLDYLFDTNERIFVLLFLLHAWEGQPYINSCGTPGNKRKVKILLVCAEFPAGVFAFNSDCIRLKKTEVILIDGRLKIFETCIHVELPRH